MITLVGDLALEALPLGCGQVLRGSHRLLGSNKGRGLSLEASICSTCLLTLPQGATAFTSIQDPSPEATAGLPEDGEQEDTPPEDTGRISFWDTDELGTKPSLRCPHYKGCPSCTALAQGLTREEQAVVRRMQESLRVENGRITISYPLNHHLLKRMRSNRRQVEPVQERIRQGLIKKGWLKDYDREIKKQLDSGAVQVISEQEVRDWEEQGGALHYITTFAVQQPGNAGHNTRVVLDMKANNFHSNLSPNNCMDQPPNSLTPS